LLQIGDKASSVGRWTFCPPLAESYIKRSYNLGLIVATNLLERTKLKDGMVKTSLNEMRLKKVAGKFFQRDCSN